MDGEPRSWLSCISNLTTNFELKALVGLLLTMDLTRHQRTLFTYLFIYKSYFVNMNWVINLPNWLACIHYTYTDKYSHRHSFKRGFYVI